MRKFLLGLLTGLVAVVFAGFSYVRFGFVDSRADIPVNAFERRFAMPSLDASLERRAPDITNPLDSNDANLIAGMNIYQTNCAGCHGDVKHPHGALADALYPRATQFVEDSPDMPENQNFYVIQHGVRMSGMPGWKQSLSDQQMWEVTTFLSHMDKLPPSVARQWKATAGGSSQGNPAPHPSPNSNMNMHMN